MTANPVAKMRSSPETVTPETIAEAALEILRLEGPDALSLRRVADALGTNHVTVYRRCGSFEGLLDICADHVAAGFPEVADTLDWATATEMRFDAAYEMWAAHADLIVLMHGRAWLGKNMMTRFYEPAMRSIVSAGRSNAQAARFFSVLYWLTMGSVVSNRANPWTPQESHAAAEKLGLDKIPTVAAVMVEVAAFDIREVFRKALRKLIAEADDH